jgi:small subunit ribosomal protein S4
MYGLSEKQFRAIFKEAAKAKGLTGDQMKQLLEQRFDNVIFRAGFAMTRMQSRQFAGHGLFLIDGHRVTSPSYRVRPGQVITVRTKSKDSPIFAIVREKHGKYHAPKWMTADAAQLKVEILAIPDAADAEQAIEMRQVVEFYSRN